MKFLALPLSLLLVLCLSAQGQSPTLNGDFNGDGVANALDLTELLGGFGLPVSSGTGNLLWAKRAFSTSFDNGNDVAFGSDGRVIVAGSFANGAVFGEGETTQATLSTGSGFHSFIARYSTDGDFVWVRHSTGGGEAANGVAVRETDNAIWATGDFTGTSTFGNGGATQLMVTSGGSNDIHLSRTSADGEIETLRRAGGAELQNAYVVDVLPDGTHLQIGSMDSGSTFGEGASELVLTALSDDRNVFVVKYNPDETPAWGRVIDLQQFNNLIDGKLLSDGRVVVAGTFDKEITLGMGEANQTTLTPIDSSSGFASDDAFLALYNSDGTLAWARSDGGMGGDGAAGVAVLPGNDGFVYCGQFEELATFGAGTPGARELNSDGATDLFIAKYSLSGDLVWARKAGGTGTSLAFEVAATPEGGAVMVGPFSETCSFGVGEPNETSLVSEGGVDSFVAKYESSGGLVWAKRIGGPGDVRAAGVAVHSDGTSAVVGSFAQTITLGEDEAGEIMLESGGNTGSVTSIFAAKFAP